MKIKPQPEPSPNNHHGIPFTISLISSLDENEKNHLIENVSDIWYYKGVAFYAFP